MTTPGDPGHVTGHNTLEDGIRAQAERFGVAVTLTGPFSVGAPNHIGVHNLEVEAIRAIAAAGGVTVTLPDEAELGELGHTTDHDTLTAAVAVLAAAPAWNEATGGTQSDVPNYNGTGQTWRVHKFTSGATFTVTRALQPFRLLVAGGGCGGIASATPQSGSGGNAGALVTNDAATIPVGNYSVTVGPGGGGQGFDGQGPWAGGWSSIAGIASAEPGSSFGNGNGPYGYPGAGVAQTSDITGTPFTYCVGGTVGQPPSAQPNSGNGGDGGPSGGTAGQPGDAGIAVVAYRIG